VAEIVLAYCASHAPMMSSARMAAPEEQRNHFFGALDHIREEAVARGVQACVVLSNEHYTNFFLENFPQICIGLGEKNWGPTEEWLPIDKVWIPGHAGLANHIARYTLNSGFDPAFSHQLELDHGIMTVYYELDHDMKIPLVPIVQNCAVPPLMPVRRAYEFGKALGEAIRSYTGLQRVAIIGAGGLSHWIGNPRVGDIAEDFDRWFLERLERGELDQVLDMPGQRARAGRQRCPRDPQLGGGRRRRGADPRPHAGLRAGLPLDHRHGRRRVGDAAGARPDLRNRGGAGHPTRGVTHMTTTDSTPGGGVDMEAVAQRVRDLSDQVMAQAKKNGLTFLEGYERVLKNMLDLEEQAARGTGQDWATTLATHARQLRPRDLGGLPRRVRDQLKS
jgi:hypothetical protein